MFIQSKEQDDIKVSPDIHFKIYAIKLRMVDELLYTKTKL